MLNVQSAVLRTERRITVWLSPGVSADTRSPVLYLNDGQNLFEPSRAFGGVTWGVAETAAALVARGLIPPIVIVGIDHGELRRAREYLPVEDARNPLARRPLATKYAEFMVSELMPRIERIFPVARDSADHAGGSFMALSPRLPRCSIRVPAACDQAPRLRRPRHLSGKPGAETMASASMWVLERRDAASRWNEETVSNVTTLVEQLRRRGSVRGGTRWWSAGAGTRKKRAQRCPTRCSSVREPARRLKFPFPAAAAVDSEHGKIVCVMSFRPEAFVAMNPRQRRIRIRRIADRPLVYATRSSLTCVPHAVIRI